MHDFSWILDKRYHSNIGMSHGILPYKKSKSNDERISAQSVDSCDLDKTKFRRSFSQGNIFENINVTSLGPITNGNSSNGGDKEGKNYGHPMLEGVSIIPCFKMDDKSSSLSKLSLNNGSTVHKNQDKSPTDSLSVSGILCYC